MSATTQVGVTVGMGMSVTVFSQGVAGGLLAVSLTGAGRQDEGKGVG